MVVATSLLPSKASELTGNEKLAIANNRKVQAIIQEMFGIDSSKPMTEGISATKTNKKNGRTVFIRKPDGKLLAETLSNLNIGADVRFEGKVSPNSGGGIFSHIHKQKDNLDTISQIRRTIKLKPLPKFGEKLFRNFGILKLVKQQQLEKLSI